MTSPERLIEASASARVAVDLFFTERGYGNMDDATVLSMYIVQQLDNEGRLS